MQCQPSTFLQTEQVSAPNLETLRGASLDGRGEALDAHRVRRIAAHTRREEFPLVFGEENHAATRLNVALNDSDPTTRIPRMANSVTGSAVDHSAMWGSGSPL